MPPVIVKHDRSPVADLKRPFNTRLYKNSSAAGSIELAYERGKAAGAEAERKRCAKIAEAEPECPGDMPPELHLVPVEDALRAAVRATKKSIAAAIRAAQ